MKSVCVKKFFCFQKLSNLRNFKCKVRETSNHDAGMKWNQVYVLLKLVPHTVLLKIRQTCHIHKETYQLICSFLGKLDQCD